MSHFWLQIADFRLQILVLELSSFQLPELSFAIYFVCSGARGRESQLLLELGPNIFVVGELNCKVTPRERERETECGQLGQLQRARSGSSSMLLLLMLKLLA